MKNTDHIKNFLTGDSYFLGKGKSLWVKVATNTKKTLKVAAGVGVGMGIGALALNLATIVDPPNVVNVNGLTIEAAIDAGLISETEKGFVINKSSSSPDGFEESGLTEYFTAENVVGRLLNGTNPYLAFSDLTVEQRFTMERVTHEIEREKEWAAWNKLNTFDDNRVSENGGNISPEPIITARVELKSEGNLKNSDEFTDTFYKKPSDNLTEDVKSLFNTLFNTMKNISRKGNYTPEEREIYEQALLVASVESNHGMSQPIAPSSQTTNLSGRDQKMSQLTVWTVGSEAFRNAQMDQMLLLQQEYNPEIKELDPRTINLLDGYIKSIGALFQLMADNPDKEINGSVSVYFNEDITLTFNLMTGENSISDKKIGKVIAFFDEFGRITDPNKVIEQFNNLSPDVQENFSDSENFGKKLKDTVGANDFKKDVDSLQGSTALNPNMATFNVPIPRKRPAWIAVADGKTVYNSGTQTLVVQPEQRHFANLLADETSTTEVDTSGKSLFESLKNKHEEAVSDFVDSLDKVEYKYPENQNGR